MNLTGLYIIWGLMILGTLIFGATVPRSALDRWDAIRIESIHLLEQINESGSVELKLKYGHSKINEIRAKRVFFFTIIVFLFIVALNVRLGFMFFGGR